MEAIDIQKKFSKFSEQWHPKIIAQMNDYHFKIARIQGEFTFHKHDETDEAFIVIEGSMVIEFSDKRIPVRAGEMIVVPKGVLHKPIAEEECKILMIEPAGTLNTGDVKNEKTVESVGWI